MDTLRPLLLVVQRVRSGQAAQVAFREMHGRAGLEGHWSRGGAGQLPGGEIESEVGLGVVAGRVATRQALQ